MTNPIMTSSDLNPLVRVIGVDGGRVNPAMIQYPQTVSVPDTSNQAAQQAGQNVVKGYQIAADTYGKLADIRGQSVPRTNGALELSRSLGQLSGDLTELAKVEQQKREHEQRKQEAEAKARQNANFTEQTVLTNEFLAQTLEQAKTENPHQARQDAIRQILGADISDDQKQELINKTFTSLNSLYKEYDENQTKLFERGQNAKATQTELDIMMQSNSLTARLRDPLISASDTRNVLDRIDDIINSGIENSGLQPMYAMDMRNRILKNLLDNAQVGAIAKEEINQRTIQYTTASNEITRILRDDYDGDPSSEEFQYRASTIALQNGLPAAFRPYGPQDRMKDNLEFERTKDALGDLKKKQLINDQNAQTYTLFDVGTRVYGVIKNATLESRLNPAITVDKMTQSLLDQWRKDRDKYRGLAEQEVKLIGQIGQASQPKETASTSTSISNDPVLGSAQQNISTTNTKYFTPVDTAKVAALNDQLSLLQAQKQELMGRWVPYGLDNFDNPGISWQRQKSIMGGVGTQVEEWKKLNPNRVAPGQGGSDATAFSNYKMPHLESFKNMVLPFKPGTTFSVSRTWAGDAEGDGTGHSKNGKPYPAIDFALEEGTPLYALSPGVVSRVFNQGNEGYGKAVEITMADGTSYLYGHLSSQEVKAGDKVVPGQLVAHSGDTGHSSGPHLHLDVWHPQKGGIDPRTWLRTVPQLIQRPVRGYGLPPSQEHHSTYSLGVISLADGGFIKNGVYHSPKGTLHNIETGESSRVIPANTHKKYNQINTRLGITQEDIQRFGYAPQPEALPSELQRVGQIKLEKRAATAFQRMKLDAAKQGIVLEPVSGFRSVKDQEDIVQGKRNRGMSTDQILAYSAPPGHSEHHSGQALDIGTTGEMDLNEKFAKTPAFAWLQRNAKRYGYTLSYPEGGTGTRYEPWHWKYNSPNGGGQPPGGVAKPMKVGRAPINRNYYPKTNNPNANYGYGELKKDPGYARKLNQVADRLNIPGQWLADVIDYESDGTHSPSIRGGAGNGYVGLIQFGELWLGDAGLTQPQIMAMSREQQLEVVYKYLARFKGHLNTVEQVYAAINIGNPYDTPAQRENATDGKPFSYHVKQLGARAGRRYQTSYDTSAVIHTTYHANCSLCNQLPRQGATVPAHYAA